VSQSTAAAPKISPNPVTVFIPRLRARPGSVPAGGRSIPTTFPGWKPSRPWQR
jgi:hypothetical protein